MKIRKIILATITILPLSLIAQQKNEKEISNKKIAIGIGLSANELNIGGMGGNLKIDYLTNKKINWGIKSILTGTKTKNSFVAYDSVGEVSFIGQNDHGHNFNLSITSTIYLLGKNQGNGAGLYTTLGLGYNHSKFVYNTTGYGGYMEQSGKNIYKSNMITNIAALGGDCKVGKGRIFLEILGVFDLIGSAKNTQISGSDKKTNKYQINNFKHKNKFIHI